MKSLLVVLLLLLASCAHAAWLPGTTFTTPAFDANPLGPDTCAASIVPLTDNLTVRRVISGPAAFEDSLVNVPPGTARAFPILNNIPRGAYTITVSSRDLAGNWSCPESIVRSARGKPARGTQLGWLRLAETQREWLATR